MAGPSDLFDLAAEWLEVCKAAVATTAGGAIERAFVSPGAPAWDCCPQLTVHVGGPAEGDTAPLSPPLQPGHRTQQVAVVPVIPLTATVIRCVPGPDASGNPPGVALLEAAAQAIDEDVWAIWAHTRFRFHDKTLFASPSSRELVFDPAFSEAPEGGCAGWQIPLRVAVGGYDPDQ